ncbi:CubicO group peptidase (beta-lactamase class C family) [Microbacterium sp. W4I4]|uniref:serine hydrolase domain-containing protein n=1 Tax=Microbacterium sp. W4I4 TaxID=3042295 RepID=UPI002780BEFA|nr:serine hydrolase domain-containing protein [Microbacterium sp. W4I4]MDQ0614096.1 CubicO group peptidase (beta-lactamase class C family) [Microbacterium sp. W4I4]
MTAYTAAFDWARRHVQAERLPTAVLGIADAAGIVALDGFGAATDAVYPQFSVTKALVGITAARAVERGLLTLETPLSAALPEFGADRDDVVRLRHLVSHTSGISEPELDTAVPLRTELLSRDRDFRAGTASRYSTIAFEGIAALTEHATGVPWHEDTFAWAHSIGADGLALDHEGSMDVVDAAEAGLDIDQFRANRSAGAGLLGRAEDLLRIGSELLRIHAGETDGILAPATLRMMLRPLTGDIPRLDPYPIERGQDWGFAFNLRTRAPGLIDRDTYGHGGWAGTEFWVHPSAGRCWVLQTNRAERPGVDIDELDNAVVSER